MSYMSVMTLIIYDPLNSFILLPSSSQTNKFCFHVFFFRYRFYIQCFLKWRCDWIFRKGHEPCLFVSFPHDTLHPVRSRPLIFPKHSPNCSPRIQAAESTGAICHQNHSSVYHKFCSQRTKKKLPPLLPRHSSWLVIQFLYSFFIHKVRWQINNMWKMIWMLPYTIKSV